MNKYLNPKNYLRSFRWRINRPPIKNVPQIAPKAIEWLDNYLKKDMIVFEWGSGGSTIYFSKKAKKIISIEHNSKWYKKVSKEIKKKNILNCELILKKPQVLNGKKYISSDKNYTGLGFENYCKAIDSSPDKSFDLVLVDGRARPSCIFHALNKVKNKGYLILDDSQRKEYLPAIELLKGWKRQDFADYNKQTSIFIHSELYEI